MRQVSVVRQVSSDHRLTIAKVAIDPAITVSTPLLRSALLELVTVLQTILKDRLLGDETVTPSSTRFDKRRLRPADVLAADLARRHGPRPALTADALCGRDAALDLATKSERPDSPRHDPSAGSRDDHSSTDNASRRWDPHSPAPGPFLGLRLPVSRPLELARGLTGADAG